MKLFLPAAGEEDKVSTGERAGKTGESADDSGAKGDGPSTCNADEPSSEQE